MATKKKSSQAERAASGAKKQTKPQIKLIVNPLCSSFAAFILKSSNGKIS